MERRIDPDALLDFVELQIYPSDNRYEACVSNSNIAEKVASGDLQQLLMHLPPVRDLSSKSSDSNFKILAPEDFNDNSWFTTATLKRFLQIVSSPDFLTIANEISQLEETRKFQLSLFAKAEVNMTSSFESKNELLRTVDMRLSELKENLSNALNQATSSKCSSKDISNIENLSHHFGAEDIRDSLQKLLESFKETNHTTTEIITPFPTSQISPPVKYGVSPAKAAQMERQLSSDSESSFSSEEDNHSPPPPIERSRTPARSSASRRSASPMRRIQIGRGGPCRPAILNIKSLNYPKSTQRDESGQSSQDEDEESERIAKQNALRLSVQDRISLFESKKKEEKDKDVEIQKPKIVEKAVLRRWSSGMSVSREKDEIVPEVVENTKLSSPEEVADVAVDDSKSKQESREKNVPTWSEQKEAELNQLFTKMMESKKPVRRHSVTNDNSKSKSKSVTKEQRGGFYDSYKQKRDEKLRKEVGKRAEKEEKFKEMEQFIDDKKAEIVSSKIKPKTNVTKVINPKKETIKAPVKKIANKPSQLPATRKSWPSAPSPKSTPKPSVTRKSQATPPAVRPNPVTKVEKSKPQLKTLKPTQPDVKKVTKSVEKKQTTVVKSAQSAKPKTRTKVETPVGPTTTAVAKPSFYKKVTKKSSVVPMETKPFLRKGTGIGPGGGAVVAKSKVVAQPLVTEFEPVQSEKSHMVETSECEAVKLETREKRNCDILIIGDEDSEEDIDSNIIVHEELESCNQLNHLNVVSSDGGVNVINKIEVVEEELMISPTAWVEREEDREDEIVVCDERGGGQVANVGGANGGVTGGGSPRVRHSLFQMLLEETGEGESGEWGNAQQPPVQKDAPKGFKRLLKFARKTKADLLLTDGSSPSSIFRRG